MLRLALTNFMVCTLAVAANAAPPDGTALFEKKVRPVLVEKCVACHGAEKQKGGLRVDSRRRSSLAGDAARRSCRASRKRACWFELWRTTAN